MKKTSALIMSVVLCLLCLTSCGSEEITLETKTVNGISIAIPSDFEEFADNTGQQVAAGPNGSVVVSASMKADLKQSEWTEENYIAIMEQKYKNIKVTEFDNKATINGLNAVKAICTGDNADGENLTFLTVFVYLDSKFQMIQLTAMTGKDASIEKNAEAVVSSIKQESK